MSVFLKSVALAVTLLVTTGSHASADAHVSAEGYRARAESAPRERGALSPKASAVRALSPAAGASESPVVELAPPVSEVVVAEIQPVAVLHDPRIRPEPVVQDATVDAPIVKVSSTDARAKRRAAAKASFEGGVASNSNGASSAAIWGVMLGCVGLPLLFLMGLYFNPLSYLKQAFRA